MTAGGDAEGPNAGPSLFALAVEGFASLPPAVRRAHDGAGERVLRGIARIDAAETAAGRRLARLLGFPPPGRDVPLELAMRGVLGRGRRGRRAREERWTRRFGDTTMVSRIGLSRGRLVERFGPATAAMRGVAVEGRLELSAERLWLFGVPLPGTGGARIEAVEAADAAGRLLFDVSITLPLVGRLVRYRGWLA